MNVKLKAALLTVATLFGAVLLSSFLAWIGDTFTAAQVAFGAQCIGLALITYAIYGLILLRLESKDNV